MVQEKSADTAAPPELPAGGASTRAIVGAIIGVAVLVLAAFLGGRLLVPVEATPDTTSAEAGFARDMQVHHNQAVEMSMVVRDETSDSDIRLLAFDIALTQQQQAGQMFGWLDTWGLPQASSEPPMTWMVRPGRDGAGHDGAGHDGAGHEQGGSDSAHKPGEPMPGLATDAQMKQLASSSGVAAEKLYLQLMIAHHKGGIEMAEAVLDRSTNRVVTSFARAMIAAQKSEIDYMTELLAARS